MYLKIQRLIYDGFVYKHICEHMSHERMGIQVQVQNRWSRVSLFCNQMCLIYKTYKLCTHYTRIPRPLSENAEVLIEDEVLSQEVQDLL